MFVNTQGLVLREVNYKEADKILTVLTRDEGKLTVTARGARRKGSRIGGASQLLAYSDMVLFCNKSRWSLNEAVTIDEFSGLRADIERLALGSYFAELLELVTDADAPDAELMSLALNSLYVLAKENSDSELIKAVFELRLMCYAGFEPMLEYCSVCGRAEPDEPMLDLENGVVRCRSCHTNGTDKSLGLTSSALAAMRYITTAPQKQIFSFRLSDAAKDVLGRICEEYLTEKTEKNFRTLDYYKKLKINKDKCI